MFYFDFTFDALYPFLLVSYPFPTRFYSFLLVSTRFLLVSTRFYSLHYLLNAISTTNVFARTNLFSRAQYQKAENNFRARLPSFPNWIYAISYVIIMQNYYCRCSEQHPGGRGAVEE